MSESMLVIAFVLVGIASFVASELVRDCERAAEDMQAAPVSDLTVTDLAE